MICPHCNTGIHEQLAVLQAQESILADLRNKPGVPAAWRILHQRCSECYRPIIYLEFTHQNGVTNRHGRLYPAGIQRQVPSEVPDPYRQDFIEGCLVLTLSPKASAAITRRTLQTIIREQAGIKRRDLDTEINDLLATGKVPSHICEDLHAVRNIGNFAAHPMKSTNTSEILEVEPGEAEWNLDVLESLFDFYFVQPARSAKRKAELNKKLKEVGKPEIK